MDRFVLTLVTSLFLALPASSFGAPIIYNESVGGDLPSSGSPLPTFTFDIGSNSVSGTVRATTTVTDYDSFAFIVPAGLQVTSASVALADFTDDLGTASWQLFKGSANYRGGTIQGPITPASPGTYVFATPPGPLFASTYNVSADGFSFSSSNGGTSSYTFSFTVAPLPEPTSLVLVGFVGLALTRRRRV